MYSTGSESHIHNPQGFFSIGGTMKAKRRENWILWTKIILLTDRVYFSSE